MFNTEIVAKDIDGIKMQLRKAYDGAGGSRCGCRS